MRYIAAEDVAKAKEMEKYITDERTGLKYELVGDYYLVVGDDEPEEDQPIRIWGQRHLRHLKRRHKVIYANLLTSGKLPEYLADMQDWLDLGPGHRMNVPGTSCGNWKWRMLPGGGEPQPCQQHPRDDPHLWPPLIKPIRLIKH